MITISTFNIQNDIKKFTNKKTDIILDYLNNNKIDILGLQEVYSKLDIDLNNKLNENYSFLGKYRYHLKRIFNRINEKTPIITKYKVISNKTYFLPILPSLLNRIITKVEVEIDNKTVSIYNTHLDYKYDVVRKRQLKKIIKIISKDTNPIILMGDFNLKNNNIIFKEFSLYMECLNITHVDINTNTWKPSKYKRAIDHIFISKDFEIIDKKVIKNIDISDHYPILVKLKIK